MICTSNDATLTEDENTGKPNPKRSTHSMGWAQLVPGHLIWWIEGDALFVQDSSPVDSVSNVTVGMFCLSDTR